MEEKLIDKKEAKEHGIICKEYTFKISQDELYVYLEKISLDERAKKDFLAKWKELKGCLKERGIKFVLDSPELVEDKIIVAKGIPPKEGIQERIEILPKFLKLTKDFPSPEELKKEGIIEKVDLREEFSRLICAEKDEGIAKWFPAIPPTPGVNVWGDPIEPPPLKKEKEIELGTNVYLDEKENLIKAKTHGVVIFEKNKIDVLPEYTIKGDVDFSIGNIHFIGEKLIIQGDVKYGFIVECKGNLELKGCTENKVFLKIKGNFLCEGIIRGEDTYVEVEGEARIRGVEFARIRINGNLHIKDYLIFSNTFVQGNIYAKEGKGIIYGGRVCAKGNIEAKVLGHEAQTKTEVMAGYIPEIVKEYLKNLEEREILLETLKKVERGIELAEKLKREKRLQPKQEEIVEKLKQEKIKIEEKIRNLHEKIKELKIGIEELKNKTIKVLQKVYSNVIIGIAEITYTVTEEITGPITFYLEDTAIKTSGKK